MVQNPTNDHLVSNIRKTYAYLFFLSLQFISGVLVVFFTDWGKISFSQIMLLQSFYVVFGLLLEVPTGALADLFSRKASLSAAALIRILAVGVYASYPNFYVFLVAEFLWAVSAAFVSGADHSLIYDTLLALDKTNESQKTFIRSENYSLFGLLVAAPIGSLIAAKLGLRYTMILIALPSLIAFIISLTLHEPPRETRPDAHQKYVRFLRTIKIGIHTLIQSKKLRLLSFDKIIVTSLAFFLIWMYQPILQKMHVPLAWFGGIFAAFTGFQILVISRIGTLERLLKSPKAFLIASTLICGLAYIFLSLQPIWYVSILLMFFITGFGISREVPYQGHINRHISSAHRATVLSSIAMAEKLFCAIIYPLVGWLLDRSPSLLLAGLGVAILASSLAILRRIKNEDLQSASAS